MTASDLCWLESAETNEIEGRLNLRHQSRFPSEPADKDFPSSIDFSNDAQPPFEDGESAASTVAEVRARAVFKNQSDGSAHSQDWLLTEVWYPLNGAVPWKP